MPLRGWEGFSQFRWRNEAETVEKRRFDERETQCSDLLCPRGLRYVAQQVAGPPRGRRRVPRRLRPAREGRLPSWLLPHARGFRQFPELRCEGCRLRSQDRLDSVRPAGPDRADGMPVHRRAGHRGSGMAAPSPGPAGIQSLRDNPYDGVARRHGRHRHPADRAGTTLGCNHLYLERRQENDRTCSGWLAGLSRRTARRKGPGAAGTSRHPPRRRLRTFRADAGNEKETARAAPRERHRGR